MLLCCFNNLMVIDTLSFLEELNIKNSYWVG
jgi:hypothetical protein